MDAGIVIADEVDLFIGVKPLEVLIGAGGDHASLGGGREIIGDRFGELHKLLADLLFQLVIHLFHRAQRDMVQSDLLGVSVSDADLIGQLLG